MTIIRYRIIAADLTTMTTDARQHAADFYGVPPDDPRLLVDFLGAAPARLLVGEDDRHDYADGIGVYVPTLGWVGRFDADLQGPATWAHVLHPSIGRVIPYASEPGGQAGERADGAPVALVLACGLTVEDPSVHGTPIYIWPAAVDTMALAERVPRLSQVGVTCPACLHSAGWPDLEPLP
jgi:hypothetical protein